MVKHLLLLGATVLLLSGCGNSSRKNIMEKLPQEQIAVFVSTDKHLEDTYNWARKMALSYVHDSTDPVGYWYEAALPQREAF
jgi:outer membrane biogenesis lipoprotein LolB